MLSPDRIVRFNEELEDRPLHVLVAAGPYHTADHSQLAYRGSALEDFAKVCHEQRPDVAILVF